MFKCQDCLYLTDRRHNLNRHIKTKHQTRQNELKTSSVEKVNNGVEKINNFVEKVNKIVDQNDINVEKVNLLKISNLEIPEKVSEKNGKIAKNPNFKCQNCQKEYKTKRYYDKHISSCSLEIDNTLQCQYCRKNLSCKQAKSKHLKICHAKEAYQLIQQQNKNANNNIQTQNNNNQTIINNTNHYNISNIKQSIRRSKYTTINNDSSDDEEYTHIERNDFGKENIDYIPQETLDELTHAIDIQQLIKLKHFNPDHPENHNIRHNATSSKSLKILKDNKWQVHPKDDIFHQILNKSKSQLFSISLDHISTNRYNLTDEELIELSERWLNYDQQHQKKAIDFINIQLEELIKQRNKTKQLPLPTDSNPTTTMV
jgi:hypothetical protein